jgi:hypothetical protein
MAIKSFDGTTERKIKTIKSFDGTTERKIKTVKSFDGTTERSVFKSEIVVTDLLKWANTNWQRVGTCNVSWGAQHYPTDWNYGHYLGSPNPAIGYTSPGRIRQYINLINGHRYWVHIGAYRHGNSGDVLVNFPLHSSQTRDMNIHKLATYGGTTGNHYFDIQITDNSDGYVKFCYADIIDLTVALGTNMGGMTDQQILDWCRTNFAAMEGSQIVNI